MQTQKNDQKEEESKKNRANSNRTFKQLVPEIPSNPKRTVSLVQTFQSVKEILKT